MNAKNFYKYQNLTSVHLKKLNVGDPQDVKKVKEKLSASHTFDELKN
jgi:hypothetical protein